MTKSPFRMLQLADMNEMFARSPNPVVLNQINFDDPDHLTRLHQAMYGKATEFDFVARCDCGALEGNFYRSTVCAVCGQMPTSDLDAAQGHLSHRAWLSMPDFVPGVLTPVAYFVLSKWLAFGNQANNYVDVINNPDLEMPADLVGVVTGRGPAYFHQDFDRLMAFFLDHHPKTSKKPNVEFIRYFLQLWRHRLFTRHLPTLANVLQPLVSPDNSKRSKRIADVASQYAMDAANTLSYLQFNMRRNAYLPNMMSAVWRAYKSAITYYVQGLADRRLSRKGSLPRRHLFGTRLHFSFRSVITPIIGPHRYDEIHLPWSIGVNLLKEDIINRLLWQHGMLIGEAVARQQRALVSYDPFIGQIIDQLLAEAPLFPSGTRGIPILFNRPPSLSRGSTQLMYISRVKRNDRDDTISFSVMVLKPMNADFDGDALTGVRLCEISMARLYEPLHPAFNYLSPNQPEVSTLISLQPQVIVTLNRALGTV